MWCAMFVVCMCHLLNATNKADADNVMSAERLILECVIRAFNYSNYKLLLGKNVICLALLAVVIAHVYI